MSIARMLPERSGKSTMRRSANDWPDSNYVAEAAAPIPPARLDRFREAHAKARATATAATGVTLASQRELAAAVNDDACAKPAAALVKCGVDHGVFVGDGAADWAGASEAGIDTAISACAGSRGAAAERRSAAPTASQRTVSGVNTDRLWAKCVKRLTNFGKCTTARLSAYHGAAGCRPELAAPALNDPHALSQMAPTMLDFRPREACAALVNSSRTASWIVSR